MIVRTPSLSILAWVTSALLATSIGVVQHAPDQAWPGGNFYMSSAGEPGAKPIATARRTIEELKEKGVECAPIQETGWGRLTRRRSREAGRSVYISPNTRQL
jgi:hypothetical protein